MKLFFAILIGLLGLLLAAVFESLHTYSIGGFITLAISAGLIHTLLEKSWKVAAAYFVVTAIAVHFGAPVLAKLAMDLLPGMLMKKFGLNLPNPENLPNLEDVKKLKDAIPFQ